jgi:hypothetical protein
MDALDLLLRFVGRPLLRVRRIFFTHGQRTETRAGPLELTFSPASTLLLDVGADGETLSVTEQSWEDPFAPPTSQENEAWVVEHGKWAAFDESAQPAYGEFVGATLTSVRPLRAAGGNICGARLTFDSRVMDFVGAADEALVFLDQQHDLRLAELKVYVGEEVSEKA